MKKFCKSVGLSLLGVLISVAVVAPIVSKAEETLNNINNNQNNIYVTGNHPRNDNIWLQYFPLTTALRRNVVISDVITPSSEWEDWAGNHVETYSMDNENPENYDGSHNHYQNLLSEVLNFATGTNAVAIWGDSSAVADGSKAWGGFFSARSNMPQFVYNEQFQKYIPEEVNLEYNAETYDAQLIGVEVDVLNDGLPGVYPNMSKTGVQIVGFGNPNSMAIEVRSEDTDKQDVSDDERRGVFESGIYFKNSIAPYGRLIVSDMQSVRIGLDFQSTLFSEGAMKLKSDQVGTGIIYNDGLSGEIYGGARWTGTEDETDWLTLRAGNGGIRIVSNDNTKELVAIDNHGGIYLNGDIFINGEKADNNVNSIKKYVWVIVILVSVNVMIIVAFGTLYIKLKRNIKTM